MMGTDRILPELVSVWSLHYECHNPKGMVGGNSGSVEYTAPNAAEAIAAGLRWVKSREAISDLFGEFVYFEISPRVIGPIDDYGSLTSGGCFRLMEWSRDRAGVDKETYCEWKIAEIKHQEAKHAAQQKHQ